MRVLRRSRLVMAGLVTAGLVAGGPLLGSAPALADIDPGSWNLTVTTTSPILPQPQTATDTQCLTEEQTKDPASYMLEQLTQGTDCTLAGNPGDKTHLATDFTCTIDGLKTTGHIDMTFTRTTMKGTVAMKVDMGDQGPQQISAAIDAKRAGECSDDDNK